MKSKSEITEEYISMINDTQRKLESYELFLKRKKDSISELCYGNRKIEDIDDELDEMLKTVSGLLDECSWTKRYISSNEYNF